MPILVVYSVSICDEGFITEFARVGSLSSVNLDVVYPACFVLESLSAVFVWAGVDLFRLCRLADGSWFIFGVE